MTTEIDDIITREKNYPFANATQGTNKGFSDPSGQFPKPEYNGKSSVNKASRGESSNNLDIKNGIPGKGLGYQPISDYDYTKVQVDESLCGHIIEVNDTPGGERILLKHTCGAGVDIQPDGTIIINSTGNRIDICSGEHTMTIEGDGTVLYTGNLNMTVTGDYNLNVKGDYNINVGGKKVLDIVGSFTKTVGGVMREYVKKSKSLTVLKETTNTLLGNVTNAIKGNLSNITDGTADYSHSGNTTFTAQTDLAISSPNVNMAAQNMTCIGSEGTFGGEGVITYSKNVFVGQTVKSNVIKANIMKADTKFVGYLAGNAAGAQHANTAGTAAKGRSTKPADQTFVSDKTVLINLDETVLPTVSELKRFLEETRFGVRECSVDADNGIFDSIDLTVPTGGITEKILDIHAIRSKMKNKNNKNNNKFILKQVSKGILASNYNDTVPTEVGRMSNKKENSGTGYSGIGPHEREGVLVKSVYSEKSSQNANQQFIPNPMFNPEVLDNIDSKTKLSINTTISKFSASSGDPVTLLHIKTLDEKKALARNLIPHVKILEIFQTLKQFSGYSLNVVEGIYKPGPKENIESGSISDLKQTGRAIVYELTSTTTGKIALSKTYDLAVYLKDNAQYDNLSLYYDTFDPNDKRHNAQIAISTPEIPRNYKAFCKMNLDTYWNGEIISSTDLIEIPENPDSVISDSMDIVDAYGEDYTSS